MVTVSSAGMLTERLELQGVRWPREASRHETIRQTTSGGADATLGATTAAAVWRGRRRRRRCSHRFYAMHRWSDTEAEDGTSRLHAT